MAPSNSLVSTSMEVMPAARMCLMAEMPIFLPAATISSFLALWRAAAVRVPTRCVGVASSVTAQVSLPSFTVMVSTV